MRGGLVIAIILLTILGSIVAGWVYLKCWYKLSKRDVATARLQRRVRISLEAQNSVPAAPAPKSNNKKNKAKTKQDDNQDSGGNSKGKEKNGIGNGDHGHGDGGWDSNGNDNGNDGWNNSGNRNSNWDGGWDNNGNDYGNGSEHKKGNAKSKQEPQQKEDEWELDESQGDKPGEPKQLEWSGEWQPEKPPKQKSREKKPQQGEWEAQDGMAQHSSYNNNHHQKGKGTESSWEDVKADFGAAMDEWDRGQEGAQARPSSPVGNW